MKSLNFIKNTFYNILRNENNFLSKIITFSITLLVLSIVTMLQPRAFATHLKLGDPLDKDIYATRDIKYNDKKETEKRKRFIKATTSPVYIYDSEKIENNIKALNQYFKDIIISTSYNEVKNFEGNNSISIPYSNYQIIKELSSNDSDLEIKLNVMIREILTLKYIDIEELNLFKYETAGIKVGTYENQTLKTTLFLVDEIDNKNTIKLKIENIVDQNLSQLPSTQKKTLTNLFYKLTMPNLIYDKKMSDFELSNRLKTEALVYKIIKKNEIIARQGEILTENKMEIIELMIDDYRNNVLDITRILTIIIFYTFMLTILYYFINLFEHDRFQDFKNYIFISIILLSNVLLFLLPQYIGYDKGEIYYGIFIPIAAFSIATLFLYSIAFAAFLSIFLSIIFYFVSGFNHYAFMFLFFSSVSAVITLSSIEKRLNILKAGIKLAFINSIISLIIFLDNIDSQLINMFIGAIANGVFSSILAIGIIILGENILNTPTLFKLQELADFSSPLLKKLFKSAIGTYNHSIIVGNISESAAEEISANGLLAKVGGYYHDIGKIDNPEYFIENQSDQNKHDSLKPSMSVAIIKAHVKIGVEKARKAKLPAKVIDIISQHHGNSLIKYFYEAAKKNNSPDKEEIQKINFRYQNDKPQFPEAAIVLLADQVEAATRALKKYTTTNIEKLIEKIVDDKFQEGLLDDSGLTLKDITKVKKIFCKVITSMYHPRIEYPSSTIKDSGETKD